MPFRSVVVELLQPLHEPWSRIVTTPSSVPPQALFGAANGQLAPGTYSVDGVDGTDDADPRHGRRRLENP